MILRVNCGCRIEQFACLEKISLLYSTAAINYLTTTVSYVRKIFVKLTNVGLYYLKSAYAWNSLVEGGGGYITGLVLKRLGLDCYSAHRYFNLHSLSNLFLIGPKLQPYLLLLQSSFAYLNR
jgi:hypothetical protein